MKFEKKTIKDTGRIVTGKTPSTSNRDYFGGEYLFVTPTDLDFNNYYIYQTNTTISELGKSKHTNQILPPNSVMFTCIGNTIGKIALNKSECLTNQQINSIIPNDENDFKFLYYYLISITPFIRNLGGGVATPIVNKTNFEGIEINIPKLPTQRKIASILSAYDDLIENNLKRIKLLEEKALMEYRILFKENKLMEFPIEDVWEIKYGKNLPQTKITEFGKYPVYGAAGRIGFYEEFNYEFPVALVTSRGNGSGVAHRTNQAAFVTNNSFAFVPKKEFVDVHFHLAEMILRDLELTQLRSGTAQPQLTIAGLIGVKLKLPNKETLIEFNKIVDPVFDLIHTLEKQNTKLREARDILLPRLMSGQIEV